MAAIYAIHVLDVHQAENFFSNDVAVNAEVHVIIHNIISCLGYKMHRLYGRGIIGLCLVETRVSGHPFRQ